MMELMRARVNSFEKNLFIKLKLNAIIFYAFKMLMKVTGFIKRSRNYALQPLKSLPLIIAI